MSKDRHDVVIMGGGLAGLTLALQLKRTRPETDVIVLEKREGPAPLATFKVGESSLEIAGHYFADVCGLRDHLDDDHLWKLGLRYYFPAGDNRDLARRVEWGPPAPRREIPFRIKTYQIDRGLFENEIAERCRKAGVDVRGGCRVQDVELDDPHVVTYSTGEEEKAATGRWVIGATGRASLLKKKLGMEREVEHKINAAWLRLGGGLKLDDLSDDSAWQDRMQQQRVRWLYTNHLMGKGYWVWLIPLSSGAISIGIVADPRFHPYDEIDTLEGAMAWLDEHEPQIGEIVRARADEIQDFLRIEHYAHGCERVYSPDRWAVTGDAGLFTDPFYSPGSDYIALSNTCITELVTRDLDGEDVGERADFYNTQIIEEFERLLHIYTNQYEIWGNPQVMCAKVCWDLLLYWGITSLRYAHGVWHDPAFTTDVKDLLDRAHRLNQRVQPFFREWHAVDDRPAEDAYQSLLPFGAVAFRRVDLERPLDPAGVKELMEVNVGRMEATAVAYFNKACERVPGAEIDGRAVNPYAISLDPARWEADGLFDAPGLTLDQARETAEGVESLWLHQEVASQL